MRTMDFNGRLDLYGLCLEEEAVERERGLI